ncbi:tetratricopeptide repeat protein [Fodinibius sediminis]|uniref:Outer membrane protein assembly factor BamD, BamD/ComL family n=1 Tax=Fodinibius sediminis TaxID=1214077 RepID=A0A521D358_9BACT|nr:tetratricopeptide repeat protein [Fodinibius sediminis]SMO65471.1 Outer membrane protein assembly factor BamD, BamD/ComL family [Fodinibius sediminis]
MVNLSKFLSIILALVIGYAVPAHGQEVQKSSSDDYQRGIQLFDRGLYEEAVGELEQFVDTHEEHQLALSAQFYLARANARMDSLNKESYYERFISRHPHSDFASTLLFDLAEEAKRKKQYSKSINLYQRSIDLGLPKKKAAEAYYWMAEVAIEAGDTEQARKYFLTVGEKYPDSEWAPKALYTRGRLFLSENNYDAATQAFELLKKQYPNAEITRRIGMALGESYYQQGRYQEAIGAFQDAMPYLDEEMKTKAVLLIAESHNYLQNFDEASANYLQYINRTKGTDKERSAHYGLGWLYHKQEIYHWASDEFEKAAVGSDELARKALYYKAVNEKLGSRYREAMETFRSFGDRFQEGPWVEQTYYEWAITAYEMGNYSEAIEVLLPLVRNEEQLEWGGKVYTLLGEAYFANEEYTRSIKAFEAAEAVTDVDPAVKREARFQKAWVQYSNQAYEAAQAIFQSLHNEVPNEEIGKEALFWSADAYYNMEEYGPAANQFSQFMQQYPDHELVGPASYSLGWSYFKMGNFKEAIGPLNTFLQKYEAPETALYPYDTDTRLRIGDAYYALGNYSDAIATYKQVLGAEPGGDYALFQIGNSYYRSERTYDAVTTLRRFLRTYPDSRLSEQAQYNIAYIYLNTGNYSQAVEEFQTVINKYPGTSWAARAQYNIGDTYYNAGDYDKAIAAYKEVMEKYPDSDYIIEAANGIEYAQVSAGKTDTGTSVLEDFLQENPQTSMADRLRFRKADKMMQAGDYNGAIEEFQQYIRITNNEELLPDAYFNMANAYEQTNQMNEAINAYQTIVQEYPDSERAGPSLAALGRVAYSRGNYQQSNDYFSQLLEQGGSQYRLEAFIGMGNAQIAMGNTGQAEEQYRSALEVNGSYDPANVGLARVAIQNGAYQDARDLLNLVAEANTTEVGAEAQYLLGVASQRSGSYEEAVQSYARVSVLYGAFDRWNAKALLGKAESFLKLQQPGEAQAALNTLVTDYPDSPEAQEAQRILDSTN